MPEGPIEVDSHQRIVVNSDYDTNNIASMDRMNEQIIHTLEVCIDILKAHCGPRSGYAMLVDSMSMGQTFEPNIFTRDGIRILSSVEFMSPLEKYIKDMLTYIGARVDNKAKDGTTTSMLLSAIFLRELLKIRNNIKTYGLSTFAFKQINENVFNFIIDILDKVYVYHVEDFLENKENYTEEDLMKAAGKVAFIQSMSSSGGNIELSKAMKEIFEKSPKVSWEFITSQHSAKETGPSFSVEVDEYDSRIRCIQATDQGLNYALNTQYIEDDVQLLVYPGSLDDMSFYTEEVDRYVRIVPTEQAFCIICQHLSAKVISTINILNQTRKKPIVVWQFSPEHKLAGQNYPWELMLLCAISGVTPLGYESGEDISKNIIHAKKVHWHDTYLDIFGTIEMPEGSCLHPFYIDESKSTKFYTSVKQAIEQEISKYKEGHKPDGNMLGIFIEMLNKLACVHRPTLRCGGPVHEQIANKDVVQDVQGAIMSSLNDGFVINGIIPLHASIYMAEREYAKISNHPLYEELTSLLRTSLEEIFTILFTKETIVNIPAMSQDKELYTNVFSQGENFVIGDYLDMLNTLEASTYPIDTNYPVMQPVDITKELFKRIEELIMKFVNTDKIIVYGGVVLNKDNLQETQA